MGKSCQSTVPPINCNPPFVSQSFTTPYGGPFGQLISPVVRLLRLCLHLSVSFYVQAQIEPQELSTPMQDMRTHHRVMWIFWRNIIPACDEKDPDSRVKPI